MLDIKIVKTEHPKQKPQDESKLGFGKIFSDHMFVMDYTAGEGWHDARVVPYGPWEMDPATTVFHYAQEIFEGMKAYKNTDGKIPAVIGFHGLGGDSGEWVGLLKYVSQGFAIAFLDVRGQAGLSEDAGGVGGTTIANPFVRGLDGDKHDLLMRDVYLDTALLARIVMGLDYVDENRIGVFGGSQGGCLSVVCAALVPQIKKCAPTYPYLADFKRVWEMDLDKDAYDGLRFYFRSYDPTHERENEIFERLGYIDIQNLAKRIKAEVLMSTGLQDNICPPSTQYAVYNKIKSKKTHIIYPDFGHEWLKGNDDLVFEFMSDL